MMWEITEFKWGFILLHQPKWALEIEIKYSSKQILSYIFAMKSISIIVIVKPLAKFQIHVKLFLYKTNYMLA